MHYATGLVTGVTAMLAGYLLWRSRLMGEVIMAVTSRGEPARYRHHIRWRR